MYCPGIFREDRPDVLRQTIRSNPLGLLISQGPDGLSANPLPFEVVETEAGDLLRAHLAHANPQVADLAAGAEVLVVFQGPQGYVSPSWYASKALNPRVVPTWNYIVVQARGQPRLVRDAAWLRTQIEHLTAEQEAGVASSWRVDDAPDDFVTSQLSLIVGLELKIDSLAGKWKLSQNRSDADHASVLTGLRVAARPELARAMTANRVQSDGA